MKHSLKEQVKGSLVRPLALTVTPGDQTKIYRLEFATGVTFKAYLVGVGSGSAVTVEYINV